MIKYSKTKMGFNLVVSQVDILTGQVHI